MIVSSFPQTLWKLWFHHMKTSESLKIGPAVVFDTLKRTGCSVALASLLKDTDSCFTPLVTTQVFLFTQMEIWEASRHPPWSKFPSHTGGRRDGRKCSYIKCVGGRGECKCKMWEKIMKGLCALNLHHKINKCRGQMM
jgi:hypothetical protein